MGNNDMRLKYLLLCASEFASREVIERGGITAEHSAAFFILRFLSMEQTHTKAELSLDEKDYLLQILFDSQK